MAAVHIISASLSQSGISTLGTGFSPRPSVGGSVGLSTKFIGKTAEWIWMPFGVVSGVGRGVGVLDAGGYCRMGMDSFGGEFGASNCNQWGLCCVKVRELMELSFEGVSGVGHGMGVLEGCPRSQRGRGLGILFPNCFRGMNRHFKAKCTKYSNVRITETTAWISDKLCVPVKTTIMLRGWSRNM